MALCSGDLDSRRPIGLEKAELQAAKPMLKSVAEVVLRRGIEGPHVKYSQTGSMLIAA